MRTRARRLADLQARLTDMRGAALRREPEEVHVDLEFRLPDDGRGALDRFAKLRRWGVRPCRHGGPNSEPRRRVEGREARLAGEEADEFGEDRSLTMQRLAALLALVGPKAMTGDVAAVRRHGGPHGGRRDDG